MLSTNLFSGFKHIRSAVVCRRNIGLAAPALQKATDPIQQLFIDKLREYKKKSTGGKLVDPTPEIERELKAELEKVARQYGGADGEDMTKFPSFTWKEPVIDPINAVQEQK